MVKLNVDIHPEHNEIATSLAWSSDSQLLSCSDDKQIFRWSSDGERVGTALSVSVFVTSVSWFPSSNKQISDNFVISCTDGTYRIMTKSGREEKKVIAHEGAVLRLKWSHDGAAIMTAGEDGDVKIWSKTGNLRTCLASLGQAVYAAAWGPDDEQVVVSSNNSLLVKAAGQAAKKSLKWPAPDGLVLCIDWSSANSLIVSGGEDCVYKVWDGFGRLLFASRPLDSVVTALAWAPNGSLFAVGAFNTLRVCDKVGWTHCRDRLTGTGSMMDIAWTPDGTQFAAAGGSGAIVFAQVVDRHFEWQSYDVSLITQRRLRVLDVASESSEEIEVAKDRVVEVAVGYDHLIVVTSAQCYIYTLQNLNTPIIFEMKAPPLFLHLCRRHFLCLDLVAGLTVFSFEGRALSSPRHQNFRPEFLRKEFVALSPELLAMVDTADPRLIQLFDAVSGKFLLKVTHNSNSEVTAVALSQSPADRLLIFVDIQRDLYLCAPFAASGLVMIKLQTQVESFLFHDDLCACASISEGHISLWYHPENALVDSDLLSLSCVREEGVDYNRSAQLLSFSSCRVALRKMDGALVYASSSLEAPLLDDFMRNGRWEEATRLCRLTSQVFLWASLAAQAINKRQLEVAETAYAELNDIPKVEFLQRVQNQSSEDVRQADLLLFRRLPDEAERLLLQTSPPLISQAIRLNVELFRWNRALELALKHRSFVEAVLAYRLQYLDEFGQTEHDPKYIQTASQFQVDVNAILADNPLDIALEQQQAAQQSSSNSSNISRN